jgi:hypothetical protein
MPRASELAGSSGSGSTTQMASNAAPVAALIFAAADELRTARQTGVTANTAKLAIPITPDLTSNQR